MSTEQLGKDLKILDKDLGYDLILGPTGDLETVGEEQNLAQAIIMRLNTMQGELTELGHSSYGSRLHEIIGEPNNERTREFIRIYTLECVNRDPRVEEVLSINVEKNTGDQNRVNIDISVKAFGLTSILNIVFPFYLEVA
ncbi:GPW/gp25 family protein [Thermoproteota archaeon]